MQAITLQDLKRAASQAGSEARVHVQVESVAQKETRDQKPYRELIVCDAESKMTLRAWSDSPAFDQSAKLASGDFIEVSGFFTSSSMYGVESKRWTCRALSDDERGSLLRGPTELRAKQEKDYVFIEQTVGCIKDPRLKRLAGLFLAEFGDRFRRTAAARNYHHARRGGLVEHVAQMMRAAEALAGVYPQLNRDLLLCGAVLHDAGKLWENALPEDGFVMPFDERGELIGHIAIGIEVVNKLWRELPLAEWQRVKPPSEDVRLHLLHLIAAHHGEMQFGSPVVPKTPEAAALHYIDNLDAKLEMFAGAYVSSPLLAPHIHERVRPLPGNVVQSLEKFTTD